LERGVKLAEGGDRKKSLRAFPRGGAPITVAKQRKERGKTKSL